MALDIDGRCNCADCRQRYEQESERDGKGTPDVEVDTLTLAVEKALTATRRDSTERAEALAMVVMEAIRRERTHHESEHHGWKD